MSWLTIAGAPTRHLHQNANDLPHLPPKEAKHQLLESLGTLASNLDGENANLSARLKDSAATSLLFVLPPLGAVATAADADGTILAGLVQSVTLSDAGCTVSIEA